MEVVKNDNELPKEESLFDQIKTDAMMGVVESIMPKLKPMIDPTMKKLEEYFGDNTKIFMIRRSLGQTPKVIVLSNLKGHYFISNEVFKPYNAILIDAENNRYNNPETEEQETSRLIAEAEEKSRLELAIRIQKIQNRNTGLEKIAKFSASSDAVMNVHDSGEWVEKLISGEFTKL